MDARGMYQYLDIYLQHARRKQRAAEFPGRAQLFFFFFLWLQCCKIFTASLAAFLVSVLAAAQPPAIPANENIFVAWER